MMRHSWALLACLLMIIGAAATYQIKYKAELAAEKASKLNHEIDALEEEISRLSARWTFLNQPGRLQALADGNKELLGLAPLNSYQIAELGDIPFPSPLAGALPPLKPAALPDGAATIQELIAQSAKPPATLADLITSQGQ